MSSVSFIIPAYNAEKYIGRTIKSLLNQTSKNFEIIIVDDGSTDKTVEKAYQTFNENGFQSFRILSQLNSGVSVARNRGLKVAKGDFVVFLDADDYVNEDLVERINSTIANSKFEIEIILWKFKIVDFKGRPCKAPSKNFFLRYEDIEEDRIYSGKEILRMNIINRSLSIHIGSAAYNRKFLIDNKLHFPKEFKFGEDLYFLFSSLYRAEKVRFINSDMYFYVQHSDSTVRKINERIFDGCLAMERLETELTHNEINDNVYDIKNDVLIGLHEFKLYNFIASYLRLKLLKNKEFRDMIINSVLNKHPKLFERFFLQIKNHSKLITKRDLPSRFIFKVFRYSPKLAVFLARIARISLKIK